MYKYWFLNLKIMEEKKIGGIKAQRVMIMFFGPWISPVLSV